MMRQKIVKGYNFKKQNLLYTFKAVCIYILWFGFIRVGVLVIVIIVDGIVYG
jgi:hypothetical protein